MHGSIYSGRSALIAFQRALDVESNNVANVNTVGFKSDTISFQDLMYEGGVGKGVTMSDPIKDFDQGQIQLTGLDYDFAISGEGFFTVVDPQDNSEHYTRAGNFRKDSNNQMVDINEMNVMGILPVVTGDKITKDFTKNIGTSIIEDDTTIISLNIYATDYARTATASGTSGTNLKTATTNVNDIEALRSAYKNALLAYEKNIAVGDVATVAIDEVSFPITTQSNGTYVPEVTINGVKFQQPFDTDIPTTLKLLSDTINTETGITSTVDVTTGTLRIESLIPGQNLSTAKAKVNGNNVVVTNISEESGSGQNLVDAIYTRLQSLIESHGGQIATVKTEIVKTPTGTPPALGAISLDLDALGISDDLIGDLKNDNGNIYLVQGDAQFLVAKLAPVVFQHSSSLRPEGHNLYSATSDSGDPLFVAEKAQVLNRHVEVSGTDLSEGLVNLMVWQKAFDANSKTVTTSDDLLKTALALKK